LREYQSVYSLTRNYKYTAANKTFSTKQVNKDSKQANKAHE